MSKLETCWTKHWAKIEKECESMDTMDAAKLRIGALLTEVEALKAECRLAQAMRQHDRRGLAKAVALLRRLTEITDHAELVGILADARAWLARGE